jgi:GNAT superfamily N-acetyltransferase
MISFYTCPCAQSAQRSAGAAPITPSLQPWLRGVVPRPRHESELQRESAATFTEGVAVNLEFAPLTKERWADFETLFGEHGAYGGCWCMWWRSTRREFAERQGTGNRQAMKEIVESGEVPGILAYAGGKAVGWCSVAPRQQYGSLERSPVLRRLDDEPVWSIVCFFVARNYRENGIAEALVRAAVDYVRERGGTVVEAYPTLPKQDRLPPVSSYMGTPAMFERAGFVVCARPSKSRVILRCFLE